MQHKIEKKYVAAMSVFAIENIPDIDPNTLYKFLELINIKGSDGWLTDELLVNKMQIMVKYVPGTRVQSLLILAELLKLKCCWETTDLAQPKPH